MATKLSPAATERLPSPLRAESRGDVQLNPISQPSFVALKSNEGGTLNAQLLWQHFDTLAETPEAVEKLRKLILEFAIRGRLVPQNPKDEPASELIKRIRSEQKRLVDDEESKLQKPLAPITLKEEPYPLPSGWVWERLGNIGVTNIGLTYSPQNISSVGFPVLRSSNIQNGKIDLSDLVRVDADVKNSVLVCQGDLLICARNGSRALVGKTALIDQLGEKTAFGAFMAIFRSSLNKYLYHFIRSPLFRRVIADVNTTTINQITQASLRTTLAPIPPLAEQHRIVAKVEELLALCDELEARQTAAGEHRTHVVRSAYFHLTDSSSLIPSLRRSGGAEGQPSSFPEHISFILHNSSLILDDVPSLRQAILSLAVEGRLVPKNSKEGNGTDVVSKFSLHELPNTDHILDLALPAHWAITAFSNLARIRSGVTKGRNLTDRKTKSFPYLRVANVQRGYLDLHVMKDIEIPVEELAKFQLKANDLLVTEGGDWDKVGRTAIWRDEITDCIHQNHVFRARLVSEELKPEWFMLYLNSPVGRRYFESAAKQTTNLASINATELRGCPVPVPPLAEQHRIVAKVNELMRWCDALDARLTAAQTTAIHLLDATLHQILETGQKTELAKL
jgi:type I restriction enzyme S subunit